MKAISFNPVAIRQSDKKEVVQAFLVSDDTPETLPSTGEGIEGMNANQVFGPFSILYVVADVPTKVYIADESGVFIAQ